MSKLKVTLKRSPIGCTRQIRDSIRCLGLRKLHSSVVVNNVPQQRGIIKKIIHMVNVEEVKA